jgi:hypothetical protein
MIEQLVPRANDTLVLVNWPLTPFLFEPLLEKLFVVLLCWPSLTVRLWTFLVNLVVLTRFVNLLRTFFESLTPACEKKNKMFSRFVDALDTLNDDIEVLADFDCFSRGFWFCFRTVQNLTLLTKMCVSFQVECSSNFKGIVDLTFNLRTKKWFVNTTLAMRFLRHWILQLCYEELCTNVATNEMQSWVHR